MTWFCTGRATDSIHYLHSALDRGPSISPDRRSRRHLTPDVMEEERPRRLSPGRSGSHDVYMTWIWGCLIFWYIHCLLMNWNIYWCSCKYFSQSTQIRKKHTLFWWWIFMFYRWYIYLLIPVQHSLKLQIIPFDCCHITFITLDNECFVYNCLNWGKCIF